MYTKNTSATKAAEVLVFFGALRSSCVFGLFWTELGCERRCVGIDWYARVVGTVGAEGVDVEHERLVVGARHASDDVDAVIVWT